MMLKELRREQEIALLVSVVDLMLELGLYVDLRIQVNHMVKQLAPVPTLARLITAADHENLRVGHVGVDVLIELVEIPDLRRGLILVRLCLVSL